MSISEANRPAATGLGAFERLLSLWVALAIAAGIGLGLLVPGLFAALQIAELEKVALQRKLDDIGRDA